MIFPSCYPSASDTSTPNADSYIYCLAAEVRELKRVLKLGFQPGYGVLLPQLQTVTKYLPIEWELIPFTGFEISFAVSWEIASSTATQLSVAWEIASAIEKQLNVAWEVNSAGITVHYNVAWGLTAPVAINYQAAWELAGPITASYLLQWGVESTGIAVALSVSWDIIAPIAISYSTSWEIAAAAIIAVELPMSCNLSETASAFYPGSWAIVETSRQTL